MRGKLKYGEHNWQKGRITPADAGKTIGEHCEARKTRDHPRGCGENGNSDGAIFMKAGSPPQVRGKPSFSVVLGLPIRITPAGAGKTSVLGCDTNF